MGTQLPNPIRIWKMAQNRGFRGPGPGRGGRGGEGVREGSPMYLDFSAPIGVFGVPPYTPPPKMCQKWCKIVLPKLHRKIHYLVGARAPRHTPPTPQITPQNHPRETPPKPPQNPTQDSYPHRPSVSFDGSKWDGSCTYSTDASSIINFLYLNIVYVFFFFNCYVNQDCHRKKKVL
jgi:hypothetical protein